MTEADQPIPFDRSLQARADRMQVLSPLVRRVIANNGGPFTFTGTCTYVVGRGTVAVIDPGPDDPNHLQALVDALPGERIETILVTHTHRDHAPGAAALKARTGASVVGCAPYAAAPTRPGIDTQTSDAAHDRAYRPDRVMADGDRLSGPGYDLLAVATPGHAANHLAFALPQENALFSGDHVMAWSTTVVAPPDGSMRAYLASLDTLSRRADSIYWPGHGGPVHDPQRFVRALAQHRRQRERAILGRIEAGDRSVEVIVGRLYVDLAPSLRGAAAQSVLAHLADLVDRGVVAADRPPSLKASYTLS